MRRLRQDWNEHGWKRNPIRFTDPRWARDGTTLCNCFFLDHKEAYRFKDTPNKKSRRREDMEQYRHLYGPPIQELRSIEVDREYHGKKKRRHSKEEIVRYRIVCAYCGVTIRWDEASRENAPYGQRELKVCLPCERRRKELI